MDVPKQLFIEQLSPKEIARIEARMRPMAFSMEGFLDHTQDLASVITSDSATIEKLGITHKQIGDRLESLMGKANRQLELKRRLPDENNSDYRGRLDRVPILSFFMRKLNMKDRLELMFTVGN